VIRLVPGPGAAPPVKPSVAERGEETGLVQRRMYQNWPGAAPRMAEEEKRQAWHSVT